MSGLWIHRYYPPEEYAALSPKILFEGRNKAVLQLRRTQNGVVRTAFVMVLKAGRSGATPQVPLWEGEADKARLAAMKKKLEDSDGDLISGRL